MNHAFRTTFLMLVVAAVAAFAAASVYPWPEAVVISDAVNKPLFEGFDTRNVRSIRIETYNEDRNEVERLLVRRKGEGIEYHDDSFPAMRSAESITTISLR